MNPFDHARDVLYHEWRRNCRLVDEYEANGETGRRQTRDDTFSGWLYGWCEARRFAADTDPAWWPVLEDASTLRDLWLFRANQSLFDYLERLEKNHARSVA